MTQPQILNAYVPVGHQHVIAEFKDGTTLIINPHDQGGFGSALAIEQILVTQSGEDCGVYNSPNQHPGNRKLPFGLVSATITKEAFVAYLRSLVTCTMEEWRSGRKQDVWYIVRLLDADLKYLTS